jgi:GNAT superfamily N-acetyltransferase
MEIRIREATVTDVRPIVEFQQAMARETESVELDLPVVSRGVQAVFDDSARGRYFVAEAEGQVIASLLITYEWSDWRDGNVWWIQSVYVRPEHRRRGVYGRMYDEVRAAATRDAGVRGIRLYVDRRNTSAQDVYRRCGMNGDHYLVFEWMK